MKSVTVIIPTYNRWPVICSAVDSVLKQTYQQTYCVVVDDASTDNTSELIKDMYGDAVRIISEKNNRGQSACRNVGVESSKSDCICFLDSDDILGPHAVASRVSLLNETPDDVVASFGLLRTSGTKSHRMLYRKKRGDKLLLSEYLQNRSWCHNNGFLIDREFFLRNGMYNTRLRNKEDIELLIRLLYHHPFSYCGEEIGQVRDVCGEKRARNDYVQMINQGTLFTDIITHIPGLKEEFSASDLQSFICSDVEETLRALYKSNRYEDFRLYYEKALREGHIADKRKFRKRYILSYAKQLFGQPT